MANSIVFANVVLLLLILATRSTYETILTGARLRPATAQRLTHIAGPGRRSIVDVHTPSKRAKNSSQRSEIKKTYLSEFYFFIVDVHMGTPVQKFTMALDFFSTTPWLIAPDAENNTFTKAGRRFIPSKSATYHNSSGYFESFWASGVLGDDLLLPMFQQEAAIAPMKQLFGLATHHFNLFFLKYLQADGMLGFSPNPTTPWGGASFLENLFQHFNGSKVITLWVNNSSIEEDMDAGLTVGGFNEKLCSSNWTYVPKTDDDYWAVNASRIRLVDIRKNKTIATIPLKGENRTIVLAPDTVKTWGPMDQVKYILAQAGCDPQTAIIPCDKVTSMRISVVFELEGGNSLDIVLKPRDYIKKIYGFCLCNYQYVDLGMPPYWQFGVQVHQKYCFQRDYSRDLIGIAPAQTYLARNQEIQID